MRRLAPLALLAALLLYPRLAFAPPPISAFPASLLPANGVAPLNTRIWVFGADAPPLAQIGLGLTIDGTPAPLDVEALGCCAVRGTLRAARTGSASAVVTSAARDIRTEFSIAAAPDHTAPSLLAADLLDAQGRLVIGVRGADDVGLAGFLARGAGEVRGAVSPGFVLTARPDPEGCVAVTAVDLAGNESPAQTVCGPGPDAGVAEDGGAADAGGDGAQGGCSCTAGSRGPALPWAVLPLLLGVRSRLARRRSAPSRIAANTRS